MVDSTNKINPKDKRLARIMAVQAIYASEIYPENSDDIFDIILNSEEEEDWIPLDATPTQEAINYGKKLHKMAVKNKNELDDLIKSRSKNWSINRITLLDRLILHISLAQMIYEGSVPPKVSIAEGV